MEPSVLPLGIHVDVQSLLPKLQSALPAGADADGAWGVIHNDFAGNVGLKYKIWRGNPTLSASGSSITLTLPIYYHAAVAQRVRNGIVVGGYSWHQVAQCGLGEAASEALVEMTYQLTWGNDYHLANTWQWKLTHVRPCQVTIFNLDMSGRVNSIAKPQLDAAAQKLSSLIHDQDFRPSAQQAWNSLRQAIKSGDGHSVLLLNPDGIEAAPLVGSASGIDTAIVLLAHPMEFEVDPTQPPPPYLPRSDFGQPVPALHVLSAPPDPLFAVNVPAHLPFAVATQDAKSKLDGKSVSWANLTSTLTVEQVGGIATVAWVKLRLAGDVEGTVYLQGTMGYDPASQEFTITNLKLTPDEIQQFPRDVISALSQPDFLNGIAAKLRWGVQSKLQEVRAQLNDLMANTTLPGHIKLSGTLQDVRSNYLVALPSDCALAGIPPEVCRDGLTQSVFIMNALVYGVVHVSQ